MPRDLVTNTFSRNWLKLPKVYMCVRKNLVEQALCCPVLFYLIYPLKGVPVYTFLKLSVRCNLNVWYQSVTIVNILYSLQLRYQPIRIWIASWNTLSSYVQLTWVQGMIYDLFWRYPMKHKTCEVIFSLFRFDYRVEEIHILYNSSLQNQVKYRILWVVMVISSSKQWTS